MGFFADATSAERWPFVLAEPDGRPLDAVETLGLGIDGPVEWLTLDDYAAAWREAAGRARAGEDRAELLTVATLDDHATKPPEII
jgi:hypothetical protein